MSLKIALVQQHADADPDGRVVARAPAGRDAILYAECDFRKNGESHARRHFLGDRRPDVYRRMGVTSERPEDRPC